MLTVTAIASNNQNRTTVKISFEKLTPKSARAALQVAGFNTGTVLDYDTQTAYRVYRNSAKKANGYF